MPKKKTVKKSSRSKNASRKKGNNDPMHAAALIDVIPKKVPVAKISGANWLTNKLMSLGIVKLKVSVSMQENPWLQIMNRETRLLGFIISCDARMELERSR